MTDDEDGATPEKASGDCLRKQMQHELRSSLYFFDSHSLFHVHCRGLVLFCRVIPVAVSSCLAALYSIRICQCGVSTKTKHAEDDVDVFNVAVGGKALVTSLCRTVGPPLLLLLHLIFMRLLFLFIVIVICTLY